MHSSLTSLRIAPVLSAVIQATLLNDNYTSPSTTITSPH
jgi:hypothetical protein